MGRYKKSHVLSQYADPRIGACAFFAGILITLIASVALAGEIYVIDVKDAISPPVASYVMENIDKALGENSDAVIIRIDTPGGLDPAMRDIIQKIMNAPIPVIVYVAPKGARAASAGAFITLASDIAAMAPGTNIGAAHPVSIGLGGGGKEGKDKTMEDKVTNDAVAYARSIAKEKGRNEQWAESAVRESISTTALDALEKGVIDIVANDIDDLLAQIDGKEVLKDSKTFVLNTKDIELKESIMGFRYRLLTILSSPEIAFILMLIGLAGLYFELSSPGAILPGVIGGISLILAFFAFQQLPVNYAGFGLILLAIIMFVAEIKVPSYGMLTVGGVVSMLLGSILLFDTPELSAQVSLGVILPVALSFCAFFVISVYLVIKAHRVSPVSGLEGMLGEQAEIYQWDAKGAGKVFCHGEYWSAKGPAGLEKGDMVEVVDIDGMSLTVKPIKDQDKTSE